MKKYKFLIFSILMLMAMVTGVISIVRKYNQNKAETAPDHKDPLMRTRMYTIDPDIDLVNICQRIGNIIPRLTNYGLRWKLVVSDCKTNADGHIKLKAEVPVFFYTDDLEVILKHGNMAGTILVDIYSASRVGNSDLGENKRHVLDLLEVLDKEFEEQIVY